MENLEINTILTLTLVLIILLWVVLIFRPWLRALLSGIRITHTEMLLMRFRNSPVNSIINEMVRARKAGVLVNRDEIEACHLSGGNVKNVIDGLVFAKAHDFKLTTKEALKLDLQKRDIVNYLREKI